MEVTPLPIIVESHIQLNIGELILKSGQVQVLRLAKLTLVCSFPGQIHHTVQSYIAIGGLTALKQKQNTCMGKENILIKFTFWQQHMIQFFLLSSSPLISNARYLQQQWIFLAFVKQIVTFARFMAGIFLQWSVLECSVSSYRFQMHLFYCSFLPSVNFQWVS